MLDFIYYPISGIMWVWHWLFSHILPDTPGGNGVAWTLSVVFLVFTLRALLYKPFVKQIRTTKKMQEIQPQMAAIRKKYPKDRMKQSEEMQKLQKEHGFNPLLGCLPMLVQIPVFIGLFHVLRSFNRMGTGFGQLGMSAEETRQTENYFFSPDLVANFLDSRLFGVPLSSAVNQPSSEWLAFSTDGQVDFTRVMIVALVVPLMIISAIATHMNARASVARQGAAALENPQTQIMNKLALYVFPLGILVSGAFFPVAIVLYWVANNLWTYGQQHLVFGRMEKEEEEAKAAKKEKQAANAPKPGAKPVDKRKKKPVASSTADVDGDDSSAEDNSASDEKSTDEKPDSGSGSSAKRGAGSKPAASASGADKAADSDADKGSDVTQNDKRPPTKRPSKKDRAAARRERAKGSSND